MLASFSLTPDVLVILPLRLPLLVPLTPEIGREEPQVRVPLRRILFRRGWHSIFLPPTRHLTTQPPRAIFAAGVPIQPYPRPQAERTTSFLTGTTLLKVISWPSTRHAHVRVPVIADDSATRKHHVTGDRVGFTVVKTVHRRWIWSSLASGWAPLAAPGPLLSVREGSRTLWPCCSHCWVGWPAPAGCSQLEFGSDVDSGSFPAPYWVPDSQGPIPRARCRWGIFRNFGSHVTGLRATGWLLLCLLLCLRLCGDGIFIAIAC